MTDWTDPAIIPEAWRADLLSRLAGRWGKEQPTCPLCQRDAWTIDPLLYEAHPFLERVTYDGQMPRAMPMVALTCGHCGNTVFINPRSVGIELPPRSIS